MQYLQLLFPITQLLAFRLANASADRRGLPYVFCNPLPAGGFHLTLLEQVRDLIRLYALLRKSRRAPAQVREDNEVPSIGLDREAFLAELDTLGADEVRLRMAQHVYGEEKKAIATEWLRRKAQATSDAQQAEQLAAASRSTDAAVQAAEAAKRSADAAERQAKAAETATRVAIAALMVAVAAAILSIVAMLRD